MSDKPITNTPMANSTTELSPKDISLPPSPLLESDDDFDIPAQGLAQYKRGGSDPNTSTRSIDHQLPIRSQNQPSSMPMTRSHTSAGLAPPIKMERAHSSPGVDSSGRFITPGYTIPRKSVFVIGASPAHINALSFFDRFQ